MFRSRRQCEQKHEKFEVDEKSRSRYDVDIVSANDSSVVVVAQVVKAVTVILFGRGRGVCTDVRVLCTGVCQLTKINCEKYLKYQNKKINNFFSNAKLGTPMYAKLDIDLKYLTLGGFCQRHHDAPCRARAAQVGDSPKPSRCF